jgi:cell wall integrity and stress response component
MKFIGFLAATLLASADALPDIIPNIRGTKTILGRYEKGVQQPSETPVLNSPKVQGCFKSSGELKMNRTIEFNSIGECATKVCYVGGYSVAGTMGGNQCWCGNTYPPKEDVVEDKNCNAPCSGYDQEACEWCGRALRLCECC